jgi:hypothetical protein
MFGKAAPVTVLRSAAIFLAGLIGATLIVEDAAGADLRIPAAPKTQETAAAPSSARLYEQFLEWLRTHPR